MKSTAKKDKDRAYVLIPSEFALEIFDFVYRLGATTTAKNLTKKWANYQEYLKKEEKEYFKALDKFDKFLNNKLSK